MCSHQASLLVIGFSGWFELVGSCVWPQTQHSSLLNMRELGWCIVSICSVRKHHVLWTTRQSVCFGSDLQQEANDRLFAAWRFKVETEPDTSPDSTPRTYMLTDLSAKIIMSQLGNP